MAAIPAISEQVASPKSAPSVPWPDGDGSEMYRNIEPCHRSSVPWDIDLSFFAAAAGDGISHIDACGALDGRGVGGASLLGLGAGTLNAYMGET